MSLRDKAREIKAEGESERGNFTPHGVPLRMYNYWLNSTDGKKALAIRVGIRKENFCHFWRVVAIWAPLLWIGRVLERVIFNPITGALVATAAAVALIASLFIWHNFAAVMGMVLVVVLALAVIVCGAVGGASLAIPEKEYRG